MVWLIISTTIRNLHIFLFVVDDRPEMYESKFDFNFTLHDTTGLHLRHELSPNFNGVIKDFTITFVHSDTFEVLFRLQIWLHNLLHYSHLSDTFPIILSDKLPLILSNAWPLYSIDFVRWIWVIFKDYIGHWSYSTDLNLQIDLALHSALILTDNPINELTLTMNASSVCATMAALPCYCTHTYFLRTEKKLCLVKLACSSALRKIKPQRFFTSFYFTESRWTGQLCIMIASTIWDIWSTIWEITVLFLIDVITPEIHRKFVLESIKTHASNIWLTLSLQIYKGNLSKNRRKHMCPI